MIVTDIRSRLRPIGHDHGGGRRGWRGGMGRSAGVRSASGDHGSEAGTRGDVTEAVHGLRYDEIARAGIAAWSAPGEPVAGHAPGEPCG